jgi:macrodomain Ter protein organizer (MatP/YcbG family)
MQDPTQLTLLLESLRSRDISFSQKDLQKALDSQSEPAIETWIDEHLGPETLLTKEELSL